MTPTRRFIHKPACTPALAGLLALALLLSQGCSGPSRPQRTIARPTTAAATPTEPAPRPTTFSVVTDEPSRYDYSVPSPKPVPASKPPKPPAPATPPPAVAAAPENPPEAPARNDAAPSTLSTPATPAPATPIAAPTPALPPTPEPPLPPPPAPAANSTTIVVEVHPSDRAIKSGKITARLGGGGGAAPIEIPATLWLVYPDSLLPAAPAPDPIAQRVAQWLGPRPHYRAVRATATDRPTALPASSGWFAELAIPTDSTAIQVFVDGEPISLPAAPKRTLTAVPHADSAAARVALSLLGADPRDHWRAALASPDPIAPLPTDPIIRGLTQRTSLNARAALNNLDPDLARRVALRLAGVVDLGNGVSLPIWPGDAAPARSLIDDLLNPITEPGRRALAAQAWLGQQPTAGAIVIDDAAAIDPRSGLTFPTVLLVNFTDHPLAASASRTEVAAGDLLRIEPMTAIPATIAADRKPDDAPPESRAAATDTRRLDPDRRTLADIHIGEWHAKRAVVGEIAKARPPGVEIRPLMADWNQASFLTAATDTTAFGPMPESPMARSVSGRLFKAAEGPAKWTFYFEVAGDPLPPPFEMVLYFGPRNAANSISLQLKPDGTLTEIRGGKSTPAGKATLTRATDRSSYFIALPAAAIEAGHILRVGLIFMDAQGRRAAWPRPMLPWDAEPGRIAVDLDAWALP